MLLLWPDCWKDSVDMFCTGCDVSSNEVLTCLLVGVIFLEMKCLICLWLGRLCPQMKLLTCMLMEWFPRQSVNMFASGRFFFPEIKCLQICYCVNCFQRQSAGMFVPGQNVSRDRVFDLYVSWWNVSRDKVFDLYVTGWNVSRHKVFDLPVYVIDGMFPESFQRQSVWLICYWIECFQRQSVWLICYRWNVSW